MNFVKKCKFYWKYGDFHVKIRVNTLKFWLFIMIRMKLRKFCWIFGNMKFEKILNQLKMRGIQYKM